MSDHNTWLEYQSGTTLHEADILYKKRIDSGLIVMEEIQASENAKRAFCLHPLVQTDIALSGFSPKLASNASVVMYVMEFRNLANQFLLPKVDTIARPRTSPIKAVNDMLIGQKVSNWIDRENQYSRKSKYDEREYFRRWFEVLEISPEKYKRLKAAVLKRIK